MRFAGLCILLGVSLLLCGCAASSSAQQQGPLTFGFWYWEGSSIDDGWAGEPVDALYVQVATLSREARPSGIPGDRAQIEHWYAYSALPRRLPAAKEYWLVVRYNERAVPDLAAASVIADELSGVLADAGARNLNVAGVQLDIDCPTSALAKYADFIHELRKKLQPGQQVSITALLDWFRSDTDIGTVIAAVDEFVPQFYDVGDPNSYTRTATIAARIDDARWGPVFNRFRKRFRIGISTFGRARMIWAAPVTDTGRFRAVMLFDDIGPIDLAVNPDFHFDAARNEAHELVLSYRAARKVRIGYTDFNAGDGVQFILATPEAVRAAVESARQIGGRLAGVVFFRWPAARETLAMQPDEVLAAAGVTAGRPHRLHVDTIDGACATVTCADVYLEGGSAFSAQPARYRVRASTPLEYFLPDGNIPVRMSGASELQLSLPPYCSRGRLYLGRAVSLRRCDFIVEPEP